MFKLKITFINSILHRNTRNMATKTAKIIDFRSDTLSLPTQEMREAIFKAVVGDDVFSEDSTTNALEAKCAKLVEKEAACYVTSGTMSNLLSVLAHCDERGSEIITGHLSHINLFEQRGVSQVVSSFGGVSVREIRNNEDGTFDISELASFVRSNRLHEPTTKLICVENTHNVLGGKVVPLDWINDLAKFAKSKNIKLHLDGARIFNAASKLNVPVSRIAKDFDSVTFCFSKGLGAPYGAIVMGSREFINRVRRTRKGIGGGVRQIGFMAAAGIYALDNLEHLKDDHTHTQMIADVIREANNPYITVPKAEDIHSNILMISVNTEKITSQELAKKLETVSQHDDDPVSIRTLTFGEDKLRIVLCCNNTHSNVLDAIVKIKKILSEIM